MRTGSEREGGEKKNEVLPPHKAVSEAGYLISANTHQSVSGLKQQRGGSIVGTAAGFALSSECVFTVDELCCHCFYTL